MDRRPGDGSYGAALTDAYTVEETRSRLAAATESYSAGRPEDAQVHVRAGGEIWARTRADVKDRVLVREVDAAFDSATGLIDRNATFDAVRDRVSPLQTQLLDGVVQDLVPREARNDPGLRASVLVRILDLADDSFAEGGRPAGGERARIAYELAFGLTVRAQAIARDIATTLGPERRGVIEALRELRSTAFPDNVSAPPEATVDDVRSETREVREALSRRYGI